MTSVLMWCRGAVQGVDGNERGIVIAWCFGEVDYANIKRYAIYVSILNCIDSEFYIAFI